jgi:RNA polymerase sigma-70 factor (family 1)
MALYHGPLLHYATTLLGSVDRAEDVVQETFVRIWERRCHWGAEGSVKSLLYRTARNLALNERRHLRVRENWKRRQTVREQPDPPTMAERRREAELLTNLEAALDSLPSRRREIFELARFHDLSYRQIAEKLGISPQTVANQISAAMRDLKRALAPYL